MGGRVPPGGCDRALGAAARRARSCTASSTWARTHVRWPGRSPPFAASSSTTSACLPSSRGWSPARSRPPSTPSSMRTCCARSRSASSSRTRSCATRCTTTSVPPSGAVSTCGSPRISPRRARRPRRIARRPRHPCRGVSDRGRHRGGYRARRGRPRRRRRLRPRRPQCGTTHALALLPGDDARTGPLLAEQARALFLASQLERATAAAAHALDVLPGGHLRSRTAALQVTLLTALGRLEEALAGSDTLLASSPEPLPRLARGKGLRPRPARPIRRRRTRGRTRARTCRARRRRPCPRIPRAVDARPGTRRRAPRASPRSTGRWRLPRDLGPAARLSGLTTQAMQLALLGFVVDADAMLTEANDVRDTLGGAALRDAARCCRDRGRLAGGKVGRRAWNGFDGWSSRSRPPRRGSCCADQRVRRSMSARNAVAAKRFAADITEVPLAGTTAAWAPRGTRGDARRRR